MKKIFIQIAFVSKFLFVTIAVFSQNVITVTDCNLNGWAKDLRNNATARFTNGPSTPLLGKGSFQLTTLDKSFGRIRNGEYSGILLSTLTELSYSTFIEQRDSTVDCGFLVLLSDINGDGFAEHNLAFDPRYQAHPFIKNTMIDQGITQEGIWQNWDALRGGWFFGHLGVNGDPDHNGLYFSLGEYISQYPNAVIRNDPTKGGPAIRLTVGGPVFSQNFIGDIDNFRIGVNSITTIHDFEFTTANAGVDKRVVYGYGSNCITLNGSAAGGVAPYTYSWSPGGSSAHSASTVVCPAATTTYTLTVTDINGCSRTDDVTVYVNGVRCGSKSDKVKICHNGEEICVAASSVAAHLNHGDILGGCETEFIPKANLEKETEIPQQLKLFNYPNPFRNTTKIAYELPFDGRSVIKIYNLNGGTVATIQNGERKKGQYSFDFNSATLSTGIYYYQITAYSKDKAMSAVNKMVIVR